MRVLIDTSYVARGASGTAVYVQALLAALRESGGVEVVEARQRRRLRPGRAGGPLGPLRSAANLALDALWLHAGLPRAARAARADAVHHPLPAHSARMGVPQVITVHDVAFLLHPDLYSRTWRLLARRSYRRAVRRAAGVICPTEATAHDAVDLLGADPARVFVVPWGPGQMTAGGPHSDRTPEGAPRQSPPNGPLLFVGNAEPRKNLDGLLGAYAAYREAETDPAELLIAGDAAGVAAGQPGVRGTPSPTSAELRELYLGARALVHPSLHEGFGLTPLEAMALGVPVLAVRNPGTVEVCAGAALLVDRAGLAEGLATIASDAALRIRLSGLGIERVRDFSWAQSARGHERAYTLARDGQASQRVPDSR